MKLYIVVMYTIYLIRSSFYHSSSWVGAVYERKLVTHTRGKGEEFEFRGGVDFGTISYMRH